MKIPAIYVEKDYWVTYALFTTELLSQEGFFSHLGITKTQNLEKKEIQFIFTILGLILLNKKMEIVSNTLKINDFLFNLNSENTFVMN